jgi:hypothetical protein
MMKIESLWCVFVCLLVDVCTEIEEPISYISGLSSTIDMMKFILNRVLEEILDTGSAATSSAVSCANRGRRRSRSLFVIG